MCHAARELGTLLIAIPQLYAASANAPLAQPITILTRSPPSLRQPHPTSAPALRSLPHGHPATQVYDRAARMGLGDCSTLYVLSDYRMEVRTQLAAQ